MDSTNSPPDPVHQPGTSKGEEVVASKGAEAGRERTVGPTSGDEPVRSRTARDASSVVSEDPIDPQMPDMPPA